MPLDQRQWRSRTPEHPPIVLDDEPERRSGLRRWQVMTVIGACTLSLVAGWVVANQGLGETSVATANTGASAPAAPTSPATAAQAPAAVAPAAGQIRVPGQCPDPAGWSTQQLASLLVVPGFNADGGWPAQVPAGVGGVFVPSGSGGVSASVFTDQLPTDPAPFVSIDYEGGLVGDHAGLIGVMPAPADQAATMSPEQVRAMAADRAGAMRHYGINVDFAPVADLDLGSPVVGNRSYGSDPNTVVTYAGAFAQGLRDNGVLPVLKHFPGHGSSDGDSHKTLAITDPWTVLKDRDVQVFKRLLSQPGPWMVMMGHLVVPGLSTDAQTPSSVDPMAYQALRSTTGFNGPVITDDLAGMRAITDRLPVPQAVVSAISAGADLALTSDVYSYPDAVAALTAWGDADPAHKAQMHSSALRAMQAMPCGRP